MDQESFWQRNLVFVVAFVLFVPVAGLTVWFMRSAPTPAQTVTTTTITPPTHTTEQLAAGRAGSEGVARGARYAIRLQAPPAASAQTAPPVAVPFGGITASANDDRNANANMTAQNTGDSFGYGGLGTTGTAWGGTEGSIGMGSVPAAQGYGSGARGRLGNRVNRGPTVRAGLPEVIGSEPTVPRTESIRMPRPASAMRVPPPPPPPVRRAVAQRPVRWVPVINMRPPPVVAAPTPPPPPPPPPVEAPPPPPRTVIDPNGRFATTYRPGAGNLTAFEAAIANRQVPPTTRELVADLGARYAPTIEAPAQGALSFRAELERTALPPGGGPLRLRLALRSTTHAATQRPPMSVHLVMDNSASMQGLAMQDARAAARLLVQRLQDTDTFSLTRFSSDAMVLVPAGPVGPRREEIITAINTIRAFGGTNISEGLRLGYQEAAAGPQTPETVKIVMLLSDGRATAGDRNAETLARMAASAFQDATQTSSFGVGTDYDGPLMARIADHGAGGYYYLRETARIGEALTTELEARAQPVAQALELRVRLRPDVQLTQTYGSRRLTTQEAAAVRQQEVVIDRQVARRDRIAQDRQEDLEGGMRFFIPGFARDDRHVILLGLHLPAGVGERDLASIELRFKDRITLRNETQTFPVRIRYADSDRASLGTLNPSVARTVQGFEAGETLARAARLIEENARPNARAMLSERSTILRQMAQSIAEPRFVEDANRIDQLAALTQADGVLSEPLLLALLLDTSARGYLH